VKTLVVSWLRSHLPIFLGCLVLTILIARPYLQRSFPYTHDNENHLVRFANYKIALKEGQFPPRFAPNLLNHYGYPVLNYNYPLANLLSLPGSFLKLNYELTFKVLVFLGIWLGLWGSWSWLSALGFPRAAKWASLANFSFTPYLLNLLFVRGNIGELLAMMILPWVFAGVEWWRHHNLKLLDISGWGLVVMALSLSHNITAALSLPLVICYLIWRLHDQPQKLLKASVTLLFGILGTLWFWLPALAEKSLIVLDGAAVNQEVSAHFVTFTQLLTSPIKFGYSYLGQIDSLSFAVGLGTWFFIVTGMWLLVKLIWQYLRTVDRAQLQLSDRGIWLGVSVMSAMMLILAQTAMFAPIYHMFTVLNFLQFPWRLGLFLAVLALPLVGIIWTQLSRSLKIVGIVLLIWQAIVGSKLQPVDFFHKNIVDYDAFTQTTSTNNENLPKDFTFQPSSDWQPTPLLADDNGQPQPAVGQIQVERWNGSSRHYALDLNQPSSMIKLG
jgi:hypothetical protein